MTDTDDGRRRLSIAIDEELKERIDEAADQEGVSTSELIRRSAKQYLDEGTLESRLSTLEERVGEIEAEQSRGVVGSILGRERSPP